MRNWLVSFAICVLLTALCYFFVDVQVANFIHGLPWEKALRSPLWSAPVLIIGFGVAFLFVGIRAFNSRTLSPWEETIVLVALSLALTMSLNEFVLKPAFGRPMPHNFFATGHHTFGWMRDVNRSSFPSGHMAQIGAIAMIVWTRYPTWRLAGAIVISVPVVLLVLGNWHFVSDLIAGGFVGAFDAALISALWRSRTDPSPRH